MLKQIAFFLLLTFSITVSSTPYDEFTDMSSISLEDLLNIKVDVASGGKALTVRESPGIISFISSDEIINSGAKDLLDVLNLVPGISFAMDVQGVVGISARGNWAHEGKILLMIDGQEFNELSYATLQFGHHFPVDTIDRIEMIRGPGSAIYGGFAELGVIKITTKKGSEMTRSEATLLTSQMSDSSGRTSVSTVAGNSFENGSINFNGFFTQGNRSDREMSDFYDDTYSMKGNSDIDSLMLNISLNYHDFSARVLKDSYRLKQRDLFFVNAPYAVQEDFESLFYELKYVWRFSDNFNVTPQYNFKEQKPWLSNGQNVRDLEDDDPDSYGGQFFDVKVTRQTGKIIANYDMNESSNITFGMSHHQDEDKGQNFRFNSSALFIQGLWQTESGNYTLGARQEKHSDAGSSFLPRLGYTKVWEKFHIKALWSKAFRAPVIQNIIDFSDTETSATQIKPENTTVTEIEMGYQFSDNLFVNANVFNIVIKDPIVYYYDSSDAYRNYEEVGTRGFEIETRYNQDWGYANFSFSYYQVSNNEVDQYAIRSVDSDLDDDIVELVTDSELLGIPKYKLTLNASYRINDDWWFNPSLIHESKKYGYTGVTDDDDEQLIADSFSSTNRLNINMVRKNLLSNTTELHFGVYNLLNDDIDYIQPYYDGYHAPLPGASREIYIKGLFKF